MATGRGPRSAATISRTSAPSAGRSAARREAATVFTNELTSELGASLAKASCGPEHFLRCSHEHPLESTAGLQSMGDIRRGPFWPRVAGARARGPAAAARGSRRPPPAGMFARALRDPWPRVCARFKALLRPCRQAADSMGWHAYGIAGQMRGSALLAAVRRAMAVDPADAPPVVLGPITVGDGRLSEMCWRRSRSTPKKLVAVVHADEPGRTGAVEGRGRLVRRAVTVAKMALRSVEATPRWDLLPPMPHEACMATACVLNGRLYVMGGEDSNPAGAGDDRANAARRSRLAWDSSMRATSALQGGFGSLVGTSLTPRHRWSFMTPSATPGALVRHSLRRAPRRAPYLPRRIAAHLDGVGENAAGRRRPSSVAPGGLRRVEARQDPRVCPSSSLGAQVPCRERSAG